jgi:hypothetical protein
MRQHRHVQFGWSCVFLLCDFLTMPQCKLELSWCEEPFAMGSVTMHTFGMFLSLHMSLALLLLLACFLQVPVVALDV